MKKKGLLGLCTLLAAALLGWAPQALAYPVWSDCAGCHGAFSASPYTSRADGQSWGNSLHNVHRTNMLNGDCNTCHVVTSRTPVYTNRSQGGTGFQPVGCVGCH